MASRCQGGCDETNMGRGAKVKQYRRNVIGYQDAKTLWLLNNHVQLRILRGMKHLILILAILAAQPASAACYADYKAKKDNPLRLHYGVAEVSQDACSKAASKASVAKRLSSSLSADGWQLLNVLSIFGDEGLAKRRESAGQFFLRY